MSGTQRVPLALALFTAALFAPAAAVCGFYLDDYSFLRALEGAGPERLWHEFIRYVPGRNLHVPFFALLLRLTGASDLALHLVSTAFDAILVFMAYHLASRLSGSRATATVTAAAFAVAPNHGETHFWITLIPQCQIPMALTLGAFLCATSPRGPRLITAFSLFTVALFTYDQVYFLWPLLLAAAWLHEERRTMKPYALAALGFATLNAAHTALRYLSPHASGGRPLIRTADAARRVYDAAQAVAHGLLPWPSTSHAHWAWTVLASVAGLGAAWWLARELKRGDPVARDWRLPAAFGAAWTAAAYGPNLFWYISPRHNLLPSFGWTLAMAAVAGALWRRRPAARPALTAAGALAFAMAVVANAHEATQWADSARLKEAFASELRRLPSAPTAVFTLDAPRRLRKAPAFNLHHDVSLAAGRALGVDLQRGDYGPTPTRAGILYFNDLSVFPADAFNWTPASGAAVLVFDGATRGFACAASLELELPGGGERRLDLRPGPCAARPRMRLEAALIESSLARPARPDAAAPRAGPLTLRAATLAARGDSTEIALEWSVTGSSLPVLAIVARGLDAADSVVLDPVFPRRSGKGSYPVLWPLVDDAAHRGLPAAGAVLRQRFALRKAPTAAVARLELTVYALEPGTRPRRLGIVTGRVARPGE
ncbi:MAG: hypothetical protein SF051_09815 [Elusimicrobiota bacterium]|nr:hypothetical protein [Elusimicrobiota bacterium]